MMRTEATRHGEHLPLLLAVLVGAIAFAVILGWLLGSPTLVQLHASFVPMQFNTALGFLCAAFALAAATRHRWHITRALGAFVALVAAATLAQYVFGTDLGIDQLLVRHDITTHSPYPGRMAHATAIAFLLTGTASVLLTVQRTRAWPRIAAEALSALTVSISLVAIAGYTTGIEQAYGWGQITRMALHSAIGFLLIGLAILIFALRDGASHRSHLWRRTYLPLAIVTLATSVSLWQALRVHEEQRIADATQAARQAVQVAFALHTDGRVRALERMAARWAARMETSRPEWEADARQYLRDDFSLVGRMDSSFALKWSVAAADAGRIRADDPDLAQLRQLCAAAHASQAPVVGGKAQNGARATGLLAAVPILGRSGGHGCMVARSDLRLFYEHPSLLRKRFDFEIAPAAGPRASPALLELAPAIRRAADSGILRHHGVPWTISAWPTAEGIAEMRSLLPNFILACGVVATVLVLTMFGLYQVAGRTAAELAAEHDRLVEAQSELERLALFDTLTTIGNRNLFLRTFQTTLAAAEESGIPAALLILDLNGFKDVNDQLGHKAGDSVLVTVAFRLVHLLAGRGHVFRIGGDEFAVVLNAGCDQDGALEIAHAIAKGVSEPIALYGESRTIGASIGVAVFPRHGRDVDAMIRKADVAMYEAKIVGQPVFANVDFGATTILRLRKKGGKLGNSG